MKVYGIINRGISHINVLKFSKMSDNMTSDGFKYSAKHSYERSSIFYNDRGTLCPRDNALVDELKNSVTKILKIISSPDKKNNNKLMSFNQIISATEDVIALSVNNPRITAFSGGVKNIRGEQYFDFTVHGYFGDKRRFLINNEGEIIKIPGDKFFTREQLSGMDKESIYYSQKEINNLEIHRYLGMFKTEISNLKNVFMGYPKIVNKQIKIQESFNEDSFMKNQKVRLDSIRKNFNTVYSGIIELTRTSVQRKKLSNLCGVKLHKKYPLMEIKDVNYKDESVFLNFTQYGSKPVTRIVVQRPNKKINQIFIDGQLAEDFSNERSNPFIVGAILKTYTPKETAESGMPEVLKGIDKKLTEAVKKLKALLGRRIDK